MNTKQKKKKVIRFIRDMLPRVYKIIFGLFYMSLFWVFFLLVFFAVAYKHKMMDKDFPLKDIFIKYYLLSVLLCLSNILNQNYSQSSIRFSKYDLTTILLIHVSIITELMMDKHSFDFRYNLDLKSKILYAILKFVIHLCISIRYNNCNFIKKKVSFIIFFKFCCIVYVLIVSESIFEKKFFLFDKEFFLYKFTSYIFVILSTFIYLIRKNGFKQSLLLSIYHLIFLFSLEMKNINVLYNH
ncbi:hypothetical protein CWI38_0186p0020 [Hamiltosporidium tvaerminnensis]|uniref:Uncharacterized protein n=1 Tax=Hamiltosporidium tvaerminnensis TaxID=1176355 RepID=A0A4Q9M2R8_9MICR|nr:hypothetical protein CWI38_0186p0020 [Hamiltosporidium tvaerminnensis]